MFFPGGFQKIKQSFFLDQRNALPLITKHNEIISWLDIEYLSGFCRDHDLTFSPTFTMPKMCFPFGGTSKPRESFFS